MANCALTFDNGGYAELAVRSAARGLIGILGGSDTIPQ